MPFTCSQGRTATLNTLLLQSARSSQHSRHEGCAGVSREQGLKENGVVRLSHITLVCSPFTQVLRPGKQLYDQMPLYTATFQFCQLSLRTSRPHLPCPTFCRRHHPLWPGLWSPWNRACFPDLRGSPVHSG